MKSRFIGILCLGLAFAVSGCGSQTVPPASSPGAAAAAPSAKGGGAVLYVLNLLQNTELLHVSVYGHMGTALLRTIDPPAKSGGFIDMTTDARGHAFLSLLPNGPLLHGPGALQVYSDDGATLVQQLHQDKHPFQLPLLDPSGNLDTLCAPRRICEYARAKSRKTLDQRVVRRIHLGKISPYDGVHDFSMGPAGQLAVNRGGEIQVFDAGSTSPAWQLDPQNLDGFTSSAFDSKGDLFIALGCQNPDYEGEVQAYLPGAKEYYLRITQGMNCPLQILTDAADNLYVLNGPFVDTIEVYKPGASQPYRTLSAGIIHPENHDMAVDRKGNLYVTNGGNYLSDHGSVVIFTPSSDQPAQTITDGIYDPVKVSIGE
jgi:hypothetical protein